MKEPEFVINANGVKIKKCCASCQTHDLYDSEGPRRLCTFVKKSHKVVFKDEVCGHWSISDLMWNIKTRR